MGLLDGKIVLVTGGSRGIGLTVVRRFLEEGASVAFTCRHLPEGLLDELGKIGPVCAFESDAVSFQGAQEVVTAVAERFGRIDVLVNNAGINKDSLLLRMTEELWDEVIANNLKSAFNYTKAVSGIMARQRSGSIIMMGSSAGLHGNIGQTNYAASKGGLVGLAKSTAKELGSRGVRANVLAPGFIDAGLLESLSDRVKEYWLNYIPLHRWGTKEEVAGAALFLASDLSTYVTGQVLDCCGGLTS
ncbi:MAG: SDR family oxidoreductase [Bacteroidales bacterium]|nr:SDR family oxidoreductase [Bacteroidales bacterium]